MTGSDVLEDDLDAVAADIRRRLEGAAGDPTAPWCIPSLATLTPDGGPAVRMVVLRAVDHKTGTLRIYTDIRSGKIAGLDRDPSVALCFWDPGVGQQLRISGQATVAQDGDAVDGIWRDLSVGTRFPYIGPSPGTPIPAPPPGRRLSLEESEAGRGVFAVITVRWTNWDWLSIEPGRHRRARFTFQDGAMLERTWLAP